MVVLIVIYKTKIYKFLKKSVIIPTTLLPCMFRYFKNQVVGL